MIVLSTAGNIKLLKNQDSTDVTQDYYFNNAVPLKFLLIKESYKMFKNLTVIRNITWASNQHIKNISEGLCDTDWRPKQLIEILILLLYCIFKQINAAQDIIRYIFFYLIFLILNQSQSFEF